MRLVPSVALVAALVVPVTIALPVVSAPAAQPHPVPPRVTQFHVTGVDSDSLRTYVTAVEQARHGSRLQATSAARDVAILTPELTAADGVSPFRLAGVSWTGPLTAGSQVFVRLHNAHGWGGWEELAISDDTPDLGSAEGRRARWGTEPILAPGSDGVQLRLDAPSGRAPSDVRVQLVDPGSSAADSSMQPKSLGSTASAASPTPPIISRAEWGADESLRGTPTYMSTVKVGFVHHTASSNSYWQTSGWTEADAAQDIRAIYAYDTLGLGWSDIAYNFLVDMAGRIYEGRAGGVDKAVMGAHTGGFNTNSFGVAALGNLDTAKPTSAMVTGIAQIMAWKLDLFHRNPNGYETLVSGGYTGSYYPAGTTATIKAISAHRDVLATACPGQYLYPYMSSIRSQAAALIGAEIVDPAISATRFAVNSAGAATVTATTPGPQNWLLQVRSSGGVLVAQSSGSTAATGPGTISTSWNLKDSTGAYVPVGTYALTLTSSNSAGSVARPWTQSVAVVLPGQYTPLTPARVLDTRSGVGASGPVPAGGTVRLLVAGRGGVPASGVSAVVLNVTVTQPRTGGFITAFPDGTGRPTASNLNFGPGQTVPNLVVVKVGSNGYVDLTNTSTGTVQLVADVAGYFMP